MGQSSHDPVKQVAIQNVFKPQNYAAKVTDNMLKRLNATIYSILIWKAIEEFGS